MRFYRLLLLLYPPSFRRGFGAQMERHLRDQLAEARRTGRPAVVIAVWWHALTDLGRSLYREWRAIVQREDALKPTAVGTDTHTRERRLMNGTLNDARFALRAFRREPAFTAVALLTLALGVGATTGIFSVVNGVILEPLSYREPDRLVVIYTDLPKIGLFKLSSSGPEIGDYRTQSDLFEQVAYVSGGGGNGFTLTGDGDPARVTTTFVSWDLLPMLGIAPVAGRLITEEEDAPNGPLAVMLSFEFWAGRFGADANVVGRQLTLNGDSYTVVGVLPRGFRLDLPPETFVPPRSDVWVGLQADLVQMDRHSHFITPVARLAEGVTAQQADTRMKVVASRLDAEHYARTGFNAHVYSLHDDLVQKAKRPLFALLGAGSFVLLIACANVANLMLARGTSREKELALRAALGAPRTRIIRQVLTESALLAAVGSVTGLALAYAALRGLVALDPANLPRLESISLDGSVLAFTATASLITLFLFGLVPAMKIVAPDLHNSLKDGGRTLGAGRTHRGLRGALVVSEVALSLMLLVGAGLLIRSFLSLTQVRPGFDPENLLTFRVSLPSSDYEADQVPMFYEQLEQRIAALPGVRAVGSISALPLSGVWGWSGTTRFLDVTNGSDGNEDDFETDRRIITPGYFQAVGARLLAGRVFDARDIRGAQRVTIIDETLARRVWPDTDPIGKRFVWGANVPNATYFEVVGVVEHQRHLTISEDGREQTYFPESQFRFNGLTVVARTDREPTMVASAIRAELKALDADVPMHDVVPMTDYVSRAVAPTRFNLILLGAFASLGLTLAVVGIYGVIAYTVGQRTQELGIRRALGAQQGDVMSIVLKEGMGLTAVGAVIGLAGALALSRFVRALLFDVTPTDPFTYGVVVFVLVLAAGAACYVPARRAASVDPTIALKG